MPYSESDKHCNECICQYCDLRGTKGCVDGTGMCDRCDNTEHTYDCIFAPEYDE